MDAIAFRDVAARGEVLGAGGVDPWIRTVRGVPAGVSCDRCKRYPLAQFKTLGALDVCMACCDAIRAREVASTPVDDEGEPLTLMRQTALSYMRQTALRPPSRQLSRMMQFALRSKSPLRPAAS
jgi:hypothetical protein